MPPAHADRSPAARLLAVGGAAVGAMAAAGLATTAYAIWEARQYTLRQVQVPVLPAGAEPVALLHISDLHLAARDTDRAAWVAGLADLSPDVVVATGDFLSAPEDLSLLRTGLGPLLSTPGLSCSAQRLLLGQAHQPGQVPARAQQKATAPARPAHRRVA